MPSEARHAEPSECEIVERERDGKREARIGRGWEWKGAELQEVARDCGVTIENEGQDS